MKKILAVDDNIANLKQISAVLSNEFDVMLADSGAMALRLAGAEQPDLVLLDVQMPEMDGLETLTRLKKDAVLRHIPVIFLTGLNDAETEVRALALGAMDFVAKPFDPEILRHRIRLQLQYAEYQLSLEKTVRDLEYNIVVSFAELIECKDENVGGHIMRTGQYVGLLARRLLADGCYGARLTERNAEMMIHAAPFHDIGKIGVSDVLLLKPGELTDDEFRAVMRHTTIGARVIDTIYRRTPTMDFLPMARQMAESHHEKWNGAGYPAGLRGEEIPLCCRILAVANVYDSCVTSRKHRPAMSHAEVCALIAAGGGVDFDPRVVAAFQAVADQFEKIDKQFEPIINELEWSLLP
ncbi:MAG: response regulator [Gracilibacteraceae bacterium]|jgi:putative two-component system response regulator|nr:response regulator [Gracilibacteraceae bacterium]